MFQKQQKLWVEEIKWDYAKYTKKKMDMYYFKKVHYGAKTSNKTNPNI